MSQKKYPKIFCDKSRKIYPRTNFAFFFISESLNFVLQLIMPQLTLIQRTKVVEFCHQTKSTIQDQRKSRKFFNKPDAITARIRRTAGKFSKLETVCNVKQERSGRKRSARSIKNVVRVLVGHSPRKSIRCLSAESNIHRASVQRIFKE